MPRSSFQKLKIIYIMEYLLKNSDEDHTVTTNQIIAYLKSHDITAERKTIYSDIDALRDFGLADPGRRGSLYSLDGCDRQPAVLCMALWL